GATTDAGPGAVSATSAATSATSSATSSAPDVERPLRRDAERNRQRILAAARELFAERGLEVTLDDVAHPAGLGVGTVARRFANREALVEALFEEKFDQLVRLADDAAREPDPWQGLVGFLTSMTEAVAGDRGLHEVLVSSAYGRDRVARARDRMIPVIGQ